MNYSIPSSGNIFSLLIVVKIRHLSKVNKFDDSVITHHYVLWLQVSTSVIYISTYESSLSHACKPGMKPLDK